MVHFRWMLSNLLAFALVFYGMPNALCADSRSEGIIIRPSNVMPRSSAEYFSSAPDTGLVIPVNIWGNVREPGLHYVPQGASLQLSMSAAGGPTETADISAIRIIRGGKSNYTDLLGSRSISLQANDVVYVSQSYRADLPLIFSGVSTLISIVTLYYVMKPRN